MSVQSIMLKIPEIHVLILSLVLVGIFLLPTCLAREPRVDPQTGKVRVIYIGDAMGVPNPFPIMEQDPLLYCTAVYACTAHQRLEQIKKSVRAYMPRRYEDYLKQDVVVLSDANKNSFRHDHFTWMKDGVQEGGQGLVMIGGAESFAQKGGYPSWGPTSVADILPCDMIPSALTFSGGRIRILDWEDEFIDSLPFEEIGAFGYFHSSNNIQPRSRANYLAELVKGSMGTLPFLMWWDIGEGRTMAQSADWTPAGGNQFMTWRYYGDYCINMMLFLAGQKLPDDLELMYLVRRRLRESSEGLSTLYSMVDIVERFGGSGNQINMMIQDIQGQKRKALDHYVSAELDQAVEEFDETLLMCQQAMEKAIEIRDEAAFWIFFTEWCVVTGTAMFTGSILWVLMIKRRLYKAVELTKLKLK